MISIQIKTMLYALTTLVLASAMTAQACQFHDGFGLPSWSPYRQMNPADMVYKPKLRLDTPRMLSAATGEKTEVTIKYAYTPSEEDESTVQLLLDAGPSVSVIDKNKVNVEGKDGEYTFTVVPAISGTYRLIITASNAKTSEFPLSRQVIYLNVSA